MKSTLIASAVLAFAALTGASAFAQSNFSIYSEGGYATPFSVSDVTRAQVKAEYFKAQMDGKLPVSSEISFTPANAGQSTLTRSEVQADATQWVQAHHFDREVDPLN